MPTRAVVGVARVTGAIRAGDPGADHPYFFGPWGWLLTDVVAIAPVPWEKGALGVWRMPEALRLAVVAGIEPAR